MNLVSKTVIESSQRGCDQNRGLGIASALSPCQPLPVSRVRRDSAHRQTTDTPGWSPWRGGLVPPAWDRAERGIPPSPLNDI